MDNYIFCISSKNPTQNLINNIKKIYELYTNPVIHVIDSDSDNFIKYKEIEVSYPEIEIHYIKNKNYELGAWKYAVENIPVNNYVCIQDTLFFNKKINFDFQLYDAYYFEYNVGFSHCQEQEYFKELKYLVKDTIYEKYCVDRFKDLSFSITTHTSFAIKKECLMNVISNFKHYPINKIHSQLTERIMALIFNYHNYNLYPLPVDTVWSKIHGGRA